MASRKEDERNERVIRSLLKLQDNRRCINCNSLGPQYVCTNFWTFVCTNCSGIHREFTHRVKSVSMAKFTTQEVEALRTGGNKCARQIYFKEWDMERHSNPDGSNVERLRDFIKHVYVDKRYTGEKAIEKPPRWKMQGGKDDVDENRKMDAYQSGFRSPSYEDTYDRRYSEGSSPGVRSPANERSNMPQSDGRRSSEVVNDWRREDRFGNGKKSEDLKSYRDGTTQKAMSPVHQRDHTSSSPPIVRPVREILGENIMLHVLEPPRVNSSMSFDGSVKAQRSGSSSSLGSADGVQVELKRDNLIDFDAISEPTTAAVKVDTQHVGVQPSFSSNDNWASFESTAEIKVVQQAPSTLNTLESSLSLLSVQPPSVPQPVTVSSTSEISFTTTNFNTNTAVSTFAQNVIRPTDAWENQCNPSLTSNINSFGPTQNSQPYQPTGDPVREMNSVITSTQVPGGRRELPGDLFSSLYPSANIPFPTCQPVHPQLPLSGTPIQYSTVAMSNNLQSAASPNPFNINNEPPQVQPSAFQSMSSLPTTGSFPQPYTSGPPQYSSQQYPFVSSFSPHPYFSTHSIPPGTPQMPGIISNPSGGDMGNSGFGNLNRTPSFSGTNPFD